MVTPWLLTWIAITAATAGALAQAPAPAAPTTPAVPPASAPGSAPATPPAPAVPSTAAPAPASALPVQPNPLGVVRAGFLRQVMTESQLLTEQYERALGKLEAELAAAGDYEEASLVQRRREELKELYATSDSTLAQSLAVPLLPAQARLTGAEARGEVLTGWRTANSAAEWAGVRVPAGRYYLELEANLMELPILPGGLAPGRSQPQESAAFEFHEVSLLAGAAENRRGFEISLSSDDTTFTPVRVGPVTFTRSPVTLRLTATSGYPGNLVRLRNARLVPATEETAVVTAAVAATGGSPEELRRSLNQSLNAVQKPLIDQYAAQLDRLAAESPAVKDAVEAEKKRLEKLGATSLAGGALRVLTTSGAVVGFEDLDGARMVLDPANTGDRFLVEHEGRRLMVRLLWVLCAPVDDRDLAARKAFALHFDMEEDHVPLLGRAAQEFTAGYLAGKSLRLLLRPGKNKDGTVAALVFLPQVGLYQNVLIDQGLAAVQAPGKEGRRGMLENTLLSNMVDRERGARRQKPPPGAWAFFGEAGK